MKNKNLILAAALGSLLLFTPKVYAGNAPLANPKQEEHLENIATEKSKKSCLREVGMLTGFGSGRISEQGKKYSVVPLSARFCYDMGEFFNKEQLKNKLFFNIEPSLNHVTRPNPNMEAGLALMLLYRMPLKERISAYFELGGGGLYTTQHLHEQSTQLNFVSYRGLGLSIFNKKKNKALNVGYRHRHFSNASTKMPNGGVDTDLVTVGFSKFF